MTENAYNLFQRGCEFLESGDPAQAANLLERASKLEPEKASVHEALGRAYFNYGQAKLAHDHFEKSVELCPSDDYGHYGLAKSHYRLGQLRKALKHIRLALAMKPDSERYQELFGRVHRRVELSSQNS